MNTGIPLILNFDLKAPLPLDQRLSVNTISELNSIPNPYSGMSVYSADTQKLYYLKNIADNQRSWVQNPNGEELVYNTGNQTISGIKNFDTYPMVNVDGEMKRVITQGDQSLGALSGIPNFPENAVYNNNILMNCSASGYLTGDGYTGNYDGGYFFGRTKISQNTIRIVETGIGNNFTPITGTSIINGTPFSGGWRWLSCSSDAKYITASREYSNLYTSNDFGKTWYATANNIENRSWRGTAMSADGKYQTAVATAAQGLTGVVVISKDYGTSWSTKVVGNSDSTTDWVAVAMSSDGKYQTIINNNGSADVVYIHRSTDYGNNFTKVGPIANSAVNKMTSLRFIAMSSDGKYQTIIGPRYILTSSNYGATWIQALESVVGATTNTPFFSVTMSADGRYQVVVTSGNNNNDGEVYISNDYGYTWKLTKSFGRFMPFTSVSNSDHGRLVVMSSKNGFIYTSNDYGNNWKIRTTKQNYTTSLTQEIASTTQETISIASTSGIVPRTTNTIPSDGASYLLIDDEIVHITGINGNVLTVSRGWGGTTPATHANGATVILSNHWSRLVMSNDGKYIIAADNNYGDPSTGNTKGGYLYISTTDEKIDGNFYADNLVYNVGDQTISGIKTFATGVNISGHVGIGINNNDKFGLYVRKSPAGVTVNPDSNSIAVFEGSGNSHITVLASNAQTAGVVLGSPADNFGSYLTWNHDNNALKLGTDKPSGFIQILTDDERVAVTITSGGNVGIGVGSPSEKLQVDGNIKASGASFTKHLTVNDTGVLLSGQNSFTFVLTHSSSTLSSGFNYFGLNDAGYSSASAGSRRRMPIIETCQIRKASWSHVVGTTGSPVTILSTGYIINTSSNPRQTGIVSTVIDSANDTTPAHYITDFSPPISVISGDLIVAALAVSGFTTAPLAVRDTVVLYCYN